MIFDNISLINLMSGLVSILLLGNLFFIKQLVQKIEFTSKSQAEVKTYNAELFQKINGVSAQLRELKIDIKDLRRLEIDVAVLKNQYNNTTEEHT